MSGSREADSPDGGERQQGQSRRRREAARPVSRKERQRGQTPRRKAARPVSKKERGSEAGLKKGERQRGQTPRRRGGVGIGTISRWREAYNRGCRLLHITLGLSQPRSIPPSVNACELSSSTLPRRQPRSSTRNAACWCLAEGLAATPRRSGLFPSCGGSLLVLLEPPRGTSPAP